MNKKDFINKLMEKTDYDEEICITINEVLENNFIIGNKNKKKIIDKLESKLDIKTADAEKIYNITMEIISDGIKNKIKHPFGK